MSSEQGFQQPPAGEPGFQQPPTGGRGAGPPELDEDAVQQFLAPDEAQAAAEAAAVPEPPGGLPAVGPALLEVKRAIEERLRQNVGQAAGATRARALEAFRDAGNIQGVGIGLGDPRAGGAAGPPGEPAVTVYVAEPASVDQVRAAVVDSMGVRAAASDQVPLDVVVTGIIDAQPHRFRLRPAPGGISVGHFRITAGTLGCLAVGRTAPRNARLLILSNNHVLANSNNAVYGDCVCQPGPADGGACPQDQVAILERFVPLNFAGGANFVDCATAWAWPDRVRRDLLFLSGGAPAFFRMGSAPVAPFLGMLVGKSGRTTQLTQGRVTALNVTVTVNYAGRLALFQDQIEVRGTGGLFSQGGDSGSAIWTWDAQRSPVGLLFAGGGDSTFANRMTRVLPALDINLST
jgi:hypothetical protein